MALLRKCCGRLLMGARLCLEIPDLGSFDVEAFLVGLLFNHNDNLFLDIANLGGGVMISENTILMM